MTVTYDPIENIFNHEDQTYGRRRVIWLVNKDGVYRDDNLENVEHKDNATITNSSQMHQYDAEDGSFDFDSIHYSTWLEQVL